MVSSKKIIYPFVDVQKFEEIDIEKVNVGAATVLGIIGGLALGPLGLLACGALGALNKKQMFVIEFKDGRKLVGQAGKLSLSNLKQAFKLREVLSDS
ncbi:hypothetical protein [Hellea balneolensis]|uniref:hypothetical protein n=1 Tax=Hellea balneolensis TaxID=287478 RepID=UPI000422CDE7|nr:hypothetical protein [Hellea balneolensis]